MEKSFAVIGFPLSHSLSPKMHKAALKAAGVKGDYIAYEISPEFFEETFCSGFPFNGCNVTVPYKEKVMPFLDEISEEAKVVGAVNTIEFSDSKKGYNTDVYGFMRSLAEDLQFSAKDKNILILGAGGASRACVYGLAKAGAKKVLIVNRTQEKAERLCEEFAAIFKDVIFAYSSLTEEAIKKQMAEQDLIVNATSVGLKKDDELLLSAGFLEASKPAVYDLIYNPARTKLLQEAESAGCRVSNGINMLVYQGAKSFEIWTGVKAPVEVMKKAIINC